MTDEDLEAVLPMRAALPAIRSALAAHGLGELAAPPRFEVGTEEGALVFTVGAERAQARVIGFRVYGRYPYPRGEEPQIVAVYDLDTGDLKGIIVGERLGALRTGAIGGVALDLLAPRKASELALLGTGRQARTQLEAAVEVLEFQHVRVFSPTASHREAFAEEMGERLQLDVRSVSHPREAVRGAEVVICATDQPSPVLDVDWLEPGAHVSTVGPKFEGAHELPVEVAAGSDLIVTDSLAQVRGYTRPFFLSGTPHIDRMIALGDIIAGKRPGRRAAGQRTLFCSVGLAGTEVVVADLALRRSGEAP